jgi:hypothetical protein
MSLGLAAQVVSSLFEIEAEYRCRAAPDPSVGCARSISWRVAPLAMQLSRWRLERLMHAKLALWLSFIVLLWSTAVGAHDIYGHLVDENGASCCSETARPHHFEQSLTVWMFVQGRWIPVPNNEIQYRTLLGDDGQTGGGHWCGWALDPTGPTGDNRGSHHLCSFAANFRSGC